MPKNIVIVGIDCGLKGAIAIISGQNPPQIFDMPISWKPIKRKNKAGKMIPRKKFYYDLPAIMTVFRKYVKDKVYIFIEKQGVRPREGAISAMTIGQGYGTLIGLAYGLGFDVTIVAPQIWKKMYDGLNTKTLKESLEKKMKDIDGAKEYSKEKISRLLKAEGKTRAREIASLLYPELADRFADVKQDGPAEALLICQYGCQQHELVQNRN